MSRWSTFAIMVRKYFAPRVKVLGLATKDGDYFATVMTTIPDKEGLVHYIVFCDKDWDSDAQIIDLLEAWLEQMIQHYNLKMGRTGQWELPE